MMALISLISFLVLIAVLVLAHEFGHFITAKASGIKVEEFGIGFPPRLLSFRKGETIYSINAIPLGGFTKMLGEEDPSAPRSLASKSAGTRLLVLGAGSFMNLILPLLLFSIAFMVPHSAVIGHVTVEDIAPDSPAAKAGIQVGDTILSLGNHTINNTGDLQRYIQLDLGHEITLHILHVNGTEEDIHVVPRWQPPAGQGAVGILTKMQDAQVITESYPFWKAIPAGTVSCVETFVLFKNSIISMVIGTAPVQVAGPVGIAQFAGEAAAAGFSPLLEFAAFLSINLAIMNILPLPALDGGRMAFVLIEKARGGKRISPKTEGLVHFIGFMMFLAFVIAVTYQDILRILSGQSIGP